MKVELSQTDDHTIELSDDSRGGGVAPVMRVDVEPQNITDISTPENFVQHGFIGFTITTASIVIDPYSRVDRQSVGKLLKILKVSGSPDVAAKAVRILEELK